jgi:hypothetical protein
MLLTASATPEFGTSTMARDIDADVGLVEMVGGNDVDLPALGGHAGILGRHLGRQRRAGSAEIGVKPGLIAQRSDLDDLVLRESKVAAGDRQRGSEQQRRNSVLHIRLLVFFVVFRRRDRCGACPCWLAAPRWQNRR